MLSEIAIDVAVRRAIAEGAVVAFSLSGGKDSTAALDGAWRKLDGLGHPRCDRVAIHADLGRAEWRSTPEMVEKVAAHFGARLIVVRHRTHDMVSRWEARFAAGKRRYAALEVLNLIGPWSSASLRFCTAEMKQQVIAPALGRAFPGRQIVSVVGIRREESVGRRAAPISKPEPRWSRRDGTRHLTWHPAVNWTAEEVFARHRLHGLPLHEAYTVYGCGRVSCAFCVLQNEADQRAAAMAPGNRGLLHHLVDMEARSTFSFQPTRWLGDLSPQFLPGSLVADLSAAKIRAARRRALEKAFPDDLRYVKIGWPRRAPTPVEAIDLVAARREILGHHGLEEVYASARSIIGRFQELMSANSEQPELAA